MAVLLDDNYGWFVGLVLAAALFVVLGLEFTFAWWFTLLAIFMLLGPVIRLIRMRVITHHRR